MRASFCGLACAAALLLLNLGYISADDSDVDDAEKRLDALTSRMVSLSKKLDSITDSKKQSDRKGKWYGKLLDRFYDVNGACPRDYFPCGPGVVGGVKCVRDYLVCDGSADCKNGADESDDVCGKLDYFSKVRDYRGLLIYDRCGSGQVFDVMTVSRKRHVWTYPPAIVTPHFPSKPTLMTNWIPPIESTGGQIQIEVSKPLTSKLDFATGNVDIVGLATVHYDTWTEELENDRLRLHVLGYRTFEKEACYLNVYKEV